jgi:nucleoside 2-deoxyribosyltransferase
MIYLASPYSDTSKIVEEMRFQAVAIVASKLLRNGFMVFSPICHCHPMSLFAKLPGNFDFWRKYDEHMIDLSDEVYVLMLDGWRESEGVTREIAYALSLGKAITYVRE